MSATTREAALEASIKAACKELRPPTIGARAGAVAKESTRAKQTHLAYLWALVEAELEDRGERQRARRVRDAKFPRLKRIDDFNFEEASHIPAATIYELASCAFVANAEPVVFIGEPGTGKSHLATALGIAACMQSRRVRFVTAAALVNELIEARDDHTPVQGRGALCAHRAGTVSDRTAGRWPATSQTLNPKVQGVRVPGDVTPAVSS